MSKIQALNSKVFFTEFQSICVCSWDFEQSKVKTEHKPKS